MSKKTIKLITTIVTFAMIMSLSLSVFAADFTPGNLTGDTTKVQNGVNKINDLGQSIIGILRSVGIVVSVIVMIVIGIKYMMGSASEKAEYKKTMIPYLVGAIILFGASALAEVVFQFATGLQGP